MSKNLIKLYFLEIPLDYVIIEIDDEWAEKNYGEELEKEVEALKEMQGRLKEFNKKI